MSTDFALGVVATLGVIALHKLYHVLDEPSIEEMEIRATAPMSSEKDDAESVITIFGFDALGEHAAFEQGVLDASPYVMYVEMACRIMGIKNYKKVKAIPAESRFGPRHKLPVAIVYSSEVDADTADSSSRSSLTLDDSRKIVNAIVHSHQNDNTKTYLDYQSLTKQQQAMSRLIENTLTQSLFWSMAHSKWATPHGRDAFRHILTQPNPPDNKVLPALARPFIAAMAFRHMHAQLLGHGIARYPRQEVLQQARQDIAALSQILGTNEYILGSSVPSLTDALLYAMLVLAFEDREIQVDLNSTKDAHPNLAAYVERMKRRYVHCQ
ncbi:MAG: hypothetical protein SGILL_009526 [Bacillariaceae sp.]